MKRFGIDHLVIEVTRRCNMQCSHCLRGNAQSIDIDMKYIDTLFSRIDHIGSITFSGGEPSLRPDIINKIIDKAGYWGVSFGNFYIVTNGKTITDDFIVTIARLYTFCIDNEMSGLALSTDQYHEKINGKSKMLRVFSFFHEKGEIPWERVLKAGRAKDWGARKGIGELLNISGDYIHGTLYLNCRGNIVSGCDFSYRQQSYKKNIICHVDDFNLNTLKQFHNVEIED